MSKRPTMFSIDDIRAEASAKRIKYLDDRFQKRFVKLHFLCEDSNTIRDAALKLIRQEIVFHLSKSSKPHDFHSFRIWNLANKLKDLKLRGSIKVTTYFTGFWNPSERKHHDELWQEAGIGLMIEELNKVMFPIRLEDISDSNASFNQVFRCTIPADAGAKMSREH